MSELIRRSDAIAIIQNAKYKFPTWPHIAEAKEDMVQAIKSAPTIDAVPVVRGEWVEAMSGVMRVWPDGQVMCSVCGQRMPSQWKKMPPYCYGCGAKMEDKP